jgi:hypothetical protein
MYIGQLLVVSHGDIIYVWEKPDLNIEITAYLYVVKHKLMNLKIYMSIYVCNV